MYRDKEAQKAYNKRYRQRPEVKHRAQLRRQTLEYKAWQKVYAIAYRKKKYGLTLETFNQLLTEQEGMCAICHRPMVKPQIDDCHTSGVTRGPLCVRCNLGLSFMEDALFRINATGYLRRFYALQSLSQKIRHEKPDGTKARPSRGILGKQEGRKATPQSSSFSTSSSQSRLA